MPITFYEPPAILDATRSRCNHPYADWCVTRIDWEIISQHERGYPIWGCTITPLLDHPDSLARLLPDGSIEYRVPRAHRGNRISRKKRAHVNGTLHNTTRKAFHKGV